MRHYKHFNNVHRHHYIHRYLHRQFAPVCGSGAQLGQGAWAGQTSALLALCLACPGSPPGSQSIHRRPVRGSVIVRDTGIREESQRRVALGGANGFHSFTTLTHPTAPYMPTLQLPFPHPSVSPKASHTHAQTQTHADKTSAT